MQFFEALFIFIAIPITVIGVTWIAVVLFNDLFKAGPRLEQEEDRKRRAYELGYKSLPPHRQYLIDQHNRQRAAIGALIGLGMLGFFDGFFDGEG
jgi:hypothetical protein